MIGGGHFAGHLIIVCKKNPQLEPEFDGCNPYMKGGDPPYMEHANNFIKFCRKIVYDMCVPFVRYLPIYLFQLLNLNSFKF